MAKYKTSILNRLMDQGYDKATAKEAWAAVKKHTGDVNKIGYKLFEQAAKGISIGVNPSDYADWKSFGEVFNTRRGEIETADREQQLATIGYSQTDYEKAQGLGIDLLAAGGTQSYEDTLAEEAIAGQKDRWGTILTGQGWDAGDISTFQGMLDEYSPDEALAMMSSLGRTDEMTAYQQEQSDLERQMFEWEQAQSSWQQGLQEQQMQWEKEQTDKQYQLQVASMSPYQWIPQWAMQNPELAEQGQTAQMPGWLAAITPGATADQQVQPGGPMPSVLSTQDWMKLSDVQKQKLGGYVNWASGSPETTGAYAAAIKRRAAPGGTSTPAWGQTEWL